MKSAIVFVTDARGLHLAELSAAVALDTQNTDTIIIFCSSADYSESSLLIDAASDRGKVLTYRSLAHELLLDEGFVGIGQHKHVTQTSLLKMHALKSLENELDRALYIDNDVLLMSDFGLEDLSFDGFPIAAVYDIAKVGELGQDSGFLARCAVYGLSSHYFNSGVIAVDMSAFARVPVEKYNLYASKHGSDCNFADNCSCNDQCTWNRTFEKNWKRLPLTANLQACAMLDPRWKTAVARHYVGPKKFIPVTRWRNDEKDMFLIARARKILDKPHREPRGLLFFEIVQRIRKFREIHSLSNVMEKVSSKINDSY